MVRMGVEHLRCFAASSEITPEYAGDLHRDDSPP